MASHCKNDLKKLQQVLTSKFGFIAMVGNQMPIVRVERKAPGGGILGRLEEVTPEGRPTGQQKGNFGKSE